MSNLDEFTKYISGLFGFINKAKLEMESFRLYADKTDPLKLRSFVNTTSGKIKSTYRLAETFYLKVNQSYQLSLDPFYMEFFKPKEGHPYRNEVNACLKEYLTRLKLFEVEFQQWLKDMNIDI